MKLKNVKVGQTVKVKKTFGTPYSFEPESQGQVGTVDYVESLDHVGNLTVRVKFSYGDTDWGNHKDIKLIEDVD